LKYLIFPTLNLVAPVIYSFGYRCTNIDAHFISP
jgi:hypothetical protein